MNANLDLIGPWANAMCDHVTKENSQGTLTLTTRKTYYKNKQAQLWFSAQRPWIIGRCTRGFPHTSVHCACCWACRSVYRIHLLSMQQTYSLSDQNGNSLKRNTAKMDVRGVDITSSKWYSWEEVSCLFYLYATFLQPCNAFVVSSEGPCLAPRYSSWWDSLVSTRHCCCSCRLPFHSAIFSRIFHKYSTQCRLSIQKNAIRALMFSRCFEELEYFSFVHVCDQLLRFLAELDDLLRLLKSWRMDSLNGWLSNFSINLLTLFFFKGTVIQDGTSSVQSRWKTISWNMVVHLMTKHWN